MRGCDLATVLWVCTGLLFLFFASAHAEIVFSNFYPMYTTDQTPDVGVTVQDATIGLDVNSATFQFSRDGGITWLPYVADSFTALGAPGWQPQDEVGQWSVEGEKYKCFLQNLGADDRSISVNLYTAEFADFTFEADVKGIAYQDDSAPHGVVFRYTNAQNYYYFYIRDRTNYCYLSRMHNGIKEELSSASVEITEDTWYHLKVEINGRSIRCFVDEALLIETTDEIHNYGKCGFIMFEESAEIQSRLAYFDNVVVNYVWKKADNCTGFPGTTNPQTITEAAVPFNQYSPDQNKIRFKIRNSNQQSAASDVYNVNISPAEHTSTPTSTPTLTPTWYIPDTATPTASPTGFVPYTETPTSTPTISPIPSSTPTHTPTFTGQASRTPTSTPTVTPSYVPDEPPSPPYLDPEPPFTKGISNLITWISVGPQDQVQYLAQCSRDYFQSIYKQSNWISSTGYKFDGLESGVEYFYRVKARNLAGESPYSNVESSIQDAELPFILAAGYMDTVITTQQGGLLQLCAVAYDSPPTSRIQSLELFYDQTSTGIFLRDDGQGGDAVANDMIYTFQANIPPGVPPMDILLTLQASDLVANRSAEWPYLTIFQSAQGQGSQVESLATSLEPAVPSWETEAARTTKGTYNPYAPIIKLAGYMTTHISQQSGGSFYLVAWVTDPQGVQDIRWVQVFLQGMPTGVYLYDNGTNGDFAAGDGFYTLFVQGIAPGIQPQSILLELQAIDSAGNTSQLWPYLSILEGGENRRPSAYITSPNDGEIFDSGSQVRIAGYGVDPEDGNLPPSNLSWTSSLDGFLGNGNELYKYLSDGDHVITLQVIDSQGAQGSDWVAITVGTPSPQDPVASASADPTSGQVPLTVQFYGSASGGTPPYSYSWNFGDGSATSTQQNPQHTYTSTGSFNAVLTVTDSTQRSDTDSLIITVTDTPNTPPTVNILQPNDGATFEYGQDITFIGEGNDAEDGALSGDSLVWRSNIDGEIGSGTSFSTSSLSANTHIITLTGTDSEGATDTDSISINIIITGNVQYHEVSYPAYGEVQSTVGLVNVRVGDKIKWEWYLYVGGNLEFYNSASDIFNQNYDQVEVWSKLTGMTSGQAGEVWIYFNDVEASSFRRTWEIE